MWKSITTILIVTALCGSFLAAATQQSEEERLYQAGSQALDDSRWQDSIQLFDQIVELKGERADAALYWKSYALNKSGDPAAALEGLQELRQLFPNSSWKTDAGALEVEIRQRSGQSVSPGDEPNDELKILALQGLLQSAPERALPALEQLAQSKDNRRLREKALFLLAQAGSQPEARKIIEALARDEAEPDTQRGAIRALGVVGDRESRGVLEKIYSSTSKNAVKKEILKSFMISGERSFLLHAAEGESDPELIEAAIQELGALGATAQLKELYAKKTDPKIRGSILNGLFIAGDRASLKDLAFHETDTALRQEAIEKLGLVGDVTDLKALYAQEKDAAVKRAILKALFLAGARTEIHELALQEAAPELRLQAIHFLGLLGASTAQDLVEIYASPDSGLEVRKAVAQALFVQGNADALVTLARRETDPEMKKILVQKISLLGSPAAKDYLLELLQN